MTLKNILPALLVALLALPLGAAVTGCCGGGGESASGGSDMDDKADKKDDKKKDDKKKDDKEQEAKNALTKDDVKKKFVKKVEKEGWKVYSNARSASGGNVIYTVAAKKDDKKATVTIYDYPKAKSRKDVAKREKGKDDTVVKEKKKYVISVRVKGDKDAAKKLMKAVD